MCLLIPGYFNQYNRRTYAREKTEQIMRNWCSFNVVVIIVIFAVKMIIIKFKCKFRCTYRTIVRCSSPLSTGTVSSSSVQYYVWPIYLVHRGHTFIHSNSFFNFSRGGGIWSEINGLLFTVTIPQAHNTCKSFIFQLNNRYAAVL